MKRLIATVVAAIFCLTPLSILGASKWTPIADKLAESVVFIELFAGTQAQGSCTGFIIDSAKHLILTAAHCDAEKILANGTVTYKMFKDERKDLLVLRASNIEGPELVLAPNGPERGDEVASMGYGFGLEDPMFRIAHISNVRMDIEGISGPFAMIDAGFVPGQSGGPVVNDKGEVVMIVQRGNDSLGLGIASDVIRDKVGRYFSQK